MLQASPRGIINNQPSCATTSCSSDKISAGVSIAFAFCVKAKESLNLRHFLSELSIILIFFLNFVQTELIFFLLRPLCLLLGIGLGICEAKFHMHFFFWHYSLDLTSHKAGSDLSTSMHSRINALFSFLGQPLATLVILLFAARQFTAHQINIAWYYPQTTRYFG